MMPRVCFLHVDFDLHSADSAAAAIARRAQGMGPFAYVATPNADHVVQLNKKPDLMPLYDNAWMTLSDSPIIEAFANASYIDLPATPGADVVATLFRRHIGCDDRVLIIGGTANMAISLRKKYGLKDLRWFDAPMGLRDDAEARAACVRFIRENPAAYVFIAVGSPQQEMIALEARVAGDCSGVAVCCGASLESITGMSAGAPIWMQDHGLEWLFRLCVEPHRLWRRYLVDAPRIFLIWHRWRSRVVNASATASGMAVSPH